MSNNGYSNVNVFNPFGITPRQAGLLATFLKTKVFDEDLGFEVEDFGEILTFGEIIESFNPEGIQVNGKAGSTYEAFSFISKEEAKLFLSYLSNAEDKPKPPTSGGWNRRRQNAAPSAPQNKGAAPAKPVLPVQPSAVDQRIDRLEALLMQVLEAQTAPSVPAKPVVPQPSAGHEMLTVENGQTVKLPDGSIVQLVLNENGSLRSRKTIVPVS